jgi:hypothetical protein
MLLEQEYVMGRKSSMDRGNDKCEQNTSRKM